MKYPASNPEYQTIYLSWPDFLPKKCPVCGSKIEKQYPDNGKLVHTLNGDINQVTYYYSCTESQCEMSKRTFNPHPRFNFDGSYFGKDVIQKISIYGIKKRFKPKHIHDLLQTEYKLSISESTIRRILAMATVVKANAIDMNTKKIIKNQNYLLLGIDGEDPIASGPALWCFIDLISSRVVHTIYLESAPAIQIKKEIEYILNEYNVPLIGVVTDRQRNLVACMRDYFPDIPHQICAFHFSQNIWNHIKLIDGVLFKNITKIIKESYFTNCSANTFVNFEEKGKIKPIDLFKPIINDLKKMKRFRTKKFEKLRGIQLYQAFSTYTNQLISAINNFPEGYRIRKIFERESKKWKEAIENNEKLYHQINDLDEKFQKIHYTLFSDKKTAIKKEKELSSQFNNILNRLKIENPKIDEKKFKSFLPKSSSSYEEILCEWVRLWNSYREGLFKYSIFPKPIQTIVELEQAFGQQKSRFYGRMSKKQIGEIILSEGDYHLRFVFCTEDELKNDIWEDSIRYNWRQLVETYGERKKVISSQWLRNIVKFEGVFNVKNLYFDKKD